jgi:hypothetical protein
LTVGAVCLAIGALIMWAAEPVEVRISEDQAQTALATQIGEPLPGMLGTTLTAERLVVDFRADDRVAIETEIAMSGFRQSARAQGTVTAGLRYNSPMSTCATLMHPASKSRLHPRRDVASMI